MNRFTLRTITFAALALASIAAAGQGTAAPKRPMTFADLMAMKRISDPQISPSGKWVLFSVTDVSLEKNTKTNHLWVVPLDASAPERQLTAGPGESFGRFSPDGKFVSMTIGDHIYLAPWDEAAGKLGAPRQLTYISGGGADGAIWSPDSHRLLFTAQVYPECSVKGGDAALAKFDPSDGKAIVGGSLPIAIYQNLAPAAWDDEDACDRAKDAAADNTPVKGQVFDGLLYRHWDHYTGQKRTHILVIDTTGMHTRDLTPASAVGDAETPTWFLGGPQEYAWAPDSNEIAYVTNLDPVPAASTNNDIFTLRLDSPGAKAVKVSTSPGSDDEPEYSPNGKYLAFRSQAHNGFESDQFRLMVYEREKKAFKDVPLKLDRPAGAPYDNWVDEFTWVPDSAAIVFASGNRGMEAIFSVAVVPGKADDPVHVRLTEGGEYAELRTYQAHGSSDVMIVTTKMSVNSPTEVMLIRAGMLGHTFYDATYVGSKPGVNLAQTKQLVLSHLNDALLNQLDLDSLESFWFTGAENTKVEGFLIKPPNFDPAKKYPVKFLMHGGPQTAWGDAWSYRWNWELMAASGYVVIGINRRGSTGYGQKFVDEVSGDWGGRAFTDLMRGLDYAEATYPFLDKTRECALGASYGGFMANWVLTHTNRFKCIVSHDGMYDPASAWGSTEEMWFNEWEFRTPADYPKGFDGFPADPKQTAAGHPAEPWRYQNLPADQDPFRKWSPARFIANAKTPTLVIHSQRDLRLDVSQGFELYTALQRQGVPSRFLYFPDESHWVLKPQNSQLWNAVVSDWCDRYTHTGKYAQTN